MSAVKTTVIVPAYNEENGLPVVLKGLQACLDDTYEILIVDDGSADRTREVGMGMGCRVVSHSVNKGKGAAMMTGVRHARGSRIIFIDADGTYPPSAVPVIAARLDRKDMVVARRRTEKSMNPVNRLGNWIFKTMMRVLYKSRVFDPLSGLYGIQKAILEKMELRSRGFEIETELTIKAAQLKIDVDQIDIPYDTRIGQTKLRPFHDGLRILKTIVMMLFLYNPTAVFTLPGLVLFLLSFLLIVLLMIGPIHIGRVFLSHHAHIFSSMMALVGLQMSVFGTAAKMYTVLHKYTIPDGITRLFTKRKFVLAVMGVGILCVTVSLVLGLGIFVQWMRSDFAPLYELKKAIFVLFLLSFGIQTLFSVVFLSIFFSELRRLEAEREDTAPLVGER